MNAPLDLKMDKATFLRWVQHQEGRWELIGGRPVMQQNPKRVHGDIARNLDDALRKRLDRTVWSVRRGDISVEAGEETRLPDVMVEPAGLPPDGLTTDAPVFIGEVLSPSSSRIDFRDKPALYFTIGSLEAYVVLSQSEPYAWVWQRGAETPRGFPNEPQELDGIDSVLTLAHWGFAMPLAEIYAGIVWR
jgi:Uma2 family endonuclease